MDRTRREFLVEVGKGMVVAGIGPALAAELNLVPARAAEDPGRLTFGPLEPLVGLMQDTAADKLLPILAERLKGGTTLDQLVSAAALANARTFGGEDYVGFHTMMALSPAYHMARELPTPRQPLPVFKVLYRNSTRIQEKGGQRDEVLHPVSPAAVPQGRVAGEVLREAVLRHDLKSAEGTLAAAAERSAEDALNQLLYAVEEGTEVHRVVMVSRSWDLLDLVGKERALTLLRQSVHYCSKNCSDDYNRMFGGARAAVAKLLDQYKLLALDAGRKEAEDAWVDRLSRAIFKGTPEQAAEAAAAALAEGIVPDAIGEAISLAANQLVLRDAGRSKEQTAAGKPVGSVHGDGIGVHASDSANAWRKIARVGNARHRVVCLILGAYQVAMDRSQRGGAFLEWEPYPRAEARNRVKATDQRDLLAAAEEAVKAKDQALACAVVQRYGDLGFGARPLFDMLLQYAVSEDGALHAEKYYRTVSEEFAASRPAFRWRHLIGLARVTASEFGHRAPGYDEACKLLKV